MQKNNFIKKIIIPLTVIVIVVATEVILRLNSLSYIQNNGIKAYSSLISVVNILGIILVVISLFFIIFLFLKYKKNKDKAIAKQSEEDAKKQEEIEQQAKLSISKPLAEETLKTRLNKWIEDVSNEELESSLFGVSVQLQEMDDYQKKLSTLIQNNGASYLNDTNALLDKVEQYILRNLRKILNCLDVYNLNDESDVKRLIMLTNEVFNDNAVQLKNVKEFLFAMTDFLNQQGDDNTDIKKLTLYKNAILDSIKEETINEPTLKF